MTDKKERIQYLYVLIDESISLSAIQKKRLKDIIQYFPSRIEKLIKTFEEEKVQKEKIEKDFIDEVKDVTESEVKKFKNRKDKKFRDVQEKVQAIRKEEEKEKGKEDVDHLFNNL